MDGFMNLAKQVSPPFSAPPSISPLIFVFPRLLSSKQGYSAYQKSQNDEDDRPAAQKQDYNSNENPYTNQQSHHGSGGGQFGIMGSSSLNSENRPGQQGE